MTITVGVPMAILISWTPAWGKWHNKGSKRYSSTNPLSHYQRSLASCFSKQSCFLFCFLSSCLLRLHVCPCWLLGFFLQGGLYAGAYVFQVNFITLSMDHVQPLRFLSLPNHPFCAFIFPFRFRIPSPLMLIIIRTGCDLSDVCILYFFPAVCYP